MFVGELFVTSDYIENMPDEYPVWGLPGIFLESSDGVLWFMRYADTSNIYQGNAWYDPKNGEGCMFTNIPSKIVEDEEKNLWLVAENQLYRHHLNTKQAQ